MLRKYLPEVFLIFAVICNNVIKSKDVKIILKSQSGNISSVNRALYDFINKYDQILKVLKFKEDKENDSASISDNDDSDDSSYENQNETQKIWLPSKVDYVRASTFKPATAAIYDSESLDDDYTDDIKKVTNTALNKTKEPVDKLSIEKKSLEYAQDDTENYSSEDNESEDIQVISIDMPPTTKSIQNKIITKNKNKKKTVTRKKPKVFQNILGEKTRFSVQRLSSRTRKNYSQPKLQFRAPFARDNSRRIKRIIYSETFSPNNIWQEIISRPIKLTNDEDPFFKSQKPKREEPNKITIVILAKPEMDDNNTFEESVKLAKDGNLEPNEHQFRNNETIILRNNYGDVCLQVPIKKCVKAIKEVNKKVCKLRFKCKANFKSAFIRNGKMECKKQYDITQSSKDSETRLRGQQNLHPLHLRKRNYNVLLVLQKI
ncbi:uncharacterized protein LOC124540684 isoform X2 [Vanessa cardui]|uniref:uncharacterized protein LOC124540684 isoform X2 n=1 Tax=Vanessa cardui TaxID=171605 RepID=UPI001F147881|nr:uncharacterized protein LOC124540684 isoform X2 [Vanessa cardui]